MPRHSVTLPPRAWPAELRQRFDAAVADKSLHQRTRLRAGLGRWLLAAASEGLPGEAFDAAIWRRRTAALQPPAKATMRQAVSLAWPAAMDRLPTSSVKSAPEDPRAFLRRRIRDLLGRFPDAWRAAAEWRLSVSNDGFDDGVLVAAWAPATIIGRLQTAATHFDLCRRTGLPVDLTPASLRAQLAAAETRETPMRPHGVLAMVEKLRHLARVLMPERDWSWLGIARNNIARRSRNFGSRNTSRIVDVLELRAAGERRLADALQAHRRATGWRERAIAHGVARGGLLMVLLAECPLRIGSVSMADLSRSLSEDYTTLILDADETKERRQDRRVLSERLAAALRQYVEVHRPVCAPDAERALIVGWSGRRAAGQTLRTSFGDATLQTLGRRITPHAVRSAVATWITANAPEEASLAGEILHHRDERAIQSYRSTADAFAASNRLAAAVTATEAVVARATGGKVSGRRRAEPFGNDRIASPIVIGG